LVAGHAAPVDIFFFAVWVALMLIPLFQEVSFLGVKFKQEVEALKSFVAAQVGDIRSEVRNAVDVRTTFSPHITIPAPVSDAQLPELEAKIKSAVSEALSAHGLKAGSTSRPTIEAPDDVTFLFATRYAIEKELRRIASGRLKVPNNRPMPIVRLGRALVEAEVLEPRLENAIREAYAVCSPAIHGEPVTQAQINFVRDVGQTWSEPSDPLSSTMPAKILAGTFSLTDEQFNSLLRLGNLYRRQALGCLNAKAYVAGSVMVGAALETLLMALTL